MGITEPGVEQGQLKGADGSPKAESLAAKTEELSSSHAPGILNGGPHAVVNIDKGAPGSRQSPVFPWKGGAFDAFRKYLLSPSFQASIQLAAGTFVVTLFTFVQELRFEHACLASIFLVVGLLLVSPDTHVGSRLAGSSIILGSLWFGGLVGACVISLGHAPHVAYTTFLIVFLGIGLLVLTTLRVKANIGVGIISNLGFGIMLNLGQFEWPAEPLWRHVYTAILRIALVAALGVVVAGVLIMPTLAGDDLRHKLSTILRDLGHIVSNGGSHLLLRRADVTKMRGAPSADEIDARSASARALALSSEDEARDEAEIERAIKPGVERLPAWTRQHRVPTLIDLRRRVARCRELFRIAAVEPPFLRLGGPPFNAFKWAPVLSSLDTLIMRVAAVESIIENDEPLLLDASFKDSFGLSLLPSLRLLFAQLAAACAIAGRAIKTDIDGENNNLTLLFEPSWALIEYELAGSLYTGLKSCWAKLEAGPNDFVYPAPEVRLLTYLGTIGTAIMEAMAAFEKTLKAAVHHPVPGDPAHVAQPVIDAIRSSKETAAGLGGLNVVKAPPTQPPPVNLMIHADMSREKTKLQEDIEAGAKSRPEMQASLASFRRSLSQRPMQHSLKEADGATAPPEKASAEKGAPAGKSAIPAERVPLMLRVKAALLRHFAWAVPLLKAIFAYDVVDVVWDLVCHDIPRAFSTPRKIWKTVWTDRWFQFGMKFYMASLVVLGILTALQADYKGTRLWNGLYIDITVVVVLSEKVDTTFQKGLIRIITTVVGMSLAALVMLDTDVATNTYGLTAITVAFAAVCGPLTLGPLKYAMFLTLISFDGLVLCGYTGHSHGSTKNYYSRLVVTCWGVLICLGFDLIFPWYAGASAMQQLGSSFVAAGEVMHDFFTIMAEELELRFDATGGASEAVLEFKKGLLRLETGTLQKRIAGPLGGVQMSIAKEGVLWHRGILAMPPIVGQTIQLMQAVLDRLSAVELMLLQKPIVSGRYSGAPWHYLHGPLRQQGKELARTSLALCKATCAVMGEFPQPQDLQNLEEAMQAMHKARMEWRRGYRERLEIFVRKIREPGPAEPLLAERSVDDGIRYQSTMFAYSKAIDKIMLLARTVAEDPWMQQRATHAHSWATWRAWIGRYGE